MIAAFSSKVAIFSIWSYWRAVSEARQPGLFDDQPDLSPWEIEAANDQLIAEVVFNRPLDTVYRYIVPDEFRELIQPGQRVRVPFGRGNSSTLGFCVRTHVGGTPGKRLKSLAEICDREPLLSQSMLDLTEWIAGRYLSGWGQVLESVIPAGVKRQAGTREIVFYRAADSLPDIDTLKLPSKQHAVLNLLLQSDDPMRVDELTAAAGCGVSPIDSLKKKNFIIPERRRVSTHSIGGEIATRQEDLKLNSEQSAALQEILKVLRESRHETLLLHGVTGSGKTEVYIQAIREVISYGRQAIVLVPEISLTPQTIRRFRARFDSVAVLHSHLSDSDRHWHWQQIASGDVQVVVGARSAVFAPVPHLGLIVIDEEHETTFKQQSVPRYHAREVARERARRDNIPLILGTATPTLETLKRTMDGEDRRIVLKERVEQRPLPPVSIVDIRNDPFIQRRHSLGRAMTNAIQVALKAGGQGILFLNLRGYSPVLWCGKCKGVTCPDCDVSLTWHKDRSRLVCHSCDFEMESPERCPTCHQPGLRLIGTGTQRLEAEVINKFPAARIARMDSDSMRKPGSHDEVLERFREHEIDLLLGTQMIAKGLDFPNVTLVGVIDADTLLYQPDLRAGERTFHLISQVAGRTGRGDKQGRVLVQTLNPDEPIIQFAAHHDFDGFAKYELKQRKVMQAPPFQSMARVILRALDERIVQAESQRICQLLRERIQAGNRPIRVLGPAPAPILRLRKYFRYHFQLTSPEQQQIEEVWREFVPTMKLAAEVDMVIDMDPVDLR
ncbi:Primosomal protein N' [Thalassoglobus neptunius]|uniref:Replication restart protein PriA n=1 Tax=Thalassoglobus neptunius TaxID=1938619 RepID=A0A5C5X498_9PLAN|nr:Primosomal protein N' [Thalassoglobus neptunius]